MSAPVPGENAKGPLRRFAALWRRPSRSLPARITLLVSGATLATSLVVTWTSMHSTYTFLRNKIDQKFPAILHSTVDRVDLWYSQRRLDIETFGRSGTVAENASKLAAVGGPSRERAQRELNQYLSYVLARFEQYEALFMLDARGRVVHWVGAKVELPTSLMLRLASVQDSRVGPIERIGGRRIQVASAAVNAAGSQRGPSLHALLRLESLEKILQSDGLGVSGEIFFVGSDGGYVTPASGRAPGAPYGRPLPGQASSPLVENYTNAAGKHVVGSALQYPAMGWTMVVEEPYADAFAPVVRALWRLAALNLCVVLLFSLIAFKLATSIAGPLKSLSVGARRVAEGETDVVIMEASEIDEIGLLTRTFNKMTARLHRNRLELQQNRLEIEAANSRLRAQNEELQRMNEALEKLSVTDGLTGLNNHRYFQDQLTREMARSERSGDPLALILVDIDNFKALNDRLGHAAGDSILKQIANVMREVVRESDLLARYGGEEFALLASKTDLAGASGLAEKIRLAVSEREFQVDDAGTPGAMRVTVSVGVAAFRGDRHALFHDADRALYRAKAAGKDCVISEGA